MNLRQVNKDLIDNSFTQEVDNHVKSIASTDILGHIKPDGVTIAVDPETGIASSLVKGAEVEQFQGDLNTLNKSGLFVADSSNTTNLPLVGSLAGRPWLIQSIADTSTTGAMQIATQSVSEYLLYFRKRTIANIWTDWVKIITSDTINKSPTSIYVDGTLGTDEVGKGTGTGANAYKTISYAINQMSKFNTRSISIRISAGTYNENLTMYDYLGARINIIGAGINSTIINEVSISGCDSVDITGVTSIKGFDVRGNVSISLFNCSKTASNTSTGLYVLSSTCYVETCTFSNCTSAYGISASNNSVIMLSSVSGTGNTTGIYCELSVIRKRSSTITGTTAQQVLNGGQIL